MMKVIGKVLELPNGKTLDGWSRVSVTPKPEEGLTEIVFRGRNDTLKKAVKAIKEAYSYRRLESSNSPPVAEITIEVLTDTEVEVIDTPSDDAQKPTLEIVGQEYDAPIESYMVKSYTALEYQKSIIAIEKAISEGNMKYIESLKTKQPDLYAYALWKIAGIETRKIHSYVVNITRFLKLDKNVPDSMYSSVGSVTNWDSLPVDDVFKNKDETLKIKEPKIMDADGSDKSLEWLVRPPSLSVEDKWIRVTQSFLGALRYPNFYSGGSWDITAGGKPAENGGGND